MGKDKTKEQERHGTIRRNKKERLAKLEMLETYLEKHHPDILEEFEPLRSFTRAARSWPQQRQQRNHPC